MALRDVIHNQDGAVTTEPTTHNTRTLNTYRVTEGRVSYSCPHCATTVVLGLLKSGTETEEDN